MSIPLLSILLITYNHKLSFTKSIESVLEQKTNFDFQVHVLDDCSTDGTSDLVKEYAEKYPNKIIPFIREINVGVIENIYLGLKNISTKYFATLEGDDYWCDENKLQLQVDALENNPDCSFCTHDTLIKNPTNNTASLKDGTRIFKDYLNIKIQNKYEFPTFAPAHTSSRVYRNIIDFDKLKNKMSIVFDYCAYWYFLNKGKMFYIDKVMSVYNCTGAGYFSSKGIEEGCSIALKAIHSINEELDFEYDKMFFDEINKHLPSSYCIEHLRQLKVLKGKNIAYNYFLKNKSEQGFAEIIPIVFYFDNNYVIPASVTFYSIMESANKNYFYKFYVLHSDITIENQRKLDFTILQFPNISLEFINMNNKLGDTWEKLNIKGHFTKETFYKMLVASLFPQYNKVITTDVDVVFLGDIAPSYFVLDENSDYYLAGVKPVGKIMHYYDCYYKDTFSDEEISKMQICAGFLVMNLNKIREDKMEEKFIECFEENVHRLNQAEQDILNLCCFPKIKLLPLENLVCSYVYDYYKNDEDFENDSQYTKEELIKAYNYPIQLHYATGIKPWNDNSCTQAQKWFEYLAKTPFWNAYNKNLSNTYKNLLKYIRSFFARVKNKIKKVVIKAFKA
jgi:lipopolysaccharide biosynthesis glycosyltransferase